MEGMMNDTKAARVAEALGVFPHDPIFTESGDLLFSYVAGGEPCVWGLSPHLWHRIATLLAELDGLRSEIAAMKSIRYECSNCGQLVRSDEAHSPCNPVLPLLRADLAASKALREVDANSFREVIKGLQTDIITARAELAARTAEYCTAIANLQAENERLRNHQSVAVVEGMIEQVTALQAEVERLRTENGIYQLMVGEPVITDYAEFRKEEAQP